MAQVADEAKSGLDPIFNPVLFLTEEQKELRQQLIEICERDIRPRARDSNDAHVDVPAQGAGGARAVPRRCCCPRSGAGWTRATSCSRPRPRRSRATATRPRPCATTMHISAVEALRLIANEYQIETWLKQVVPERRIGTLSYSDPETGSHFWYPMSSGARARRRRLQVAKKASWTTSGGFADFYVFQTTSPDFKEYSDLSVWVCNAEDAEAKPGEWDALGLRGNQSGSLLIDKKFMPENHLSARSATAPGRTTRPSTRSSWSRSSGCWNGISLGTDRHRHAATRRAAPTRTSACASATTRRSRTRSARRSSTPTPCAA